ncbi:unnamed protein product [Arabidopsis halleri]
MLRPISLDVAVLELSDAGRIVLVHDRWFLFFVHATTRSYVLSHRSQPHTLSAGLVYR